MSTASVASGSGESIVVRALASDGEVSAYFDLAARTFPGYLMMHCGRVAPDGPGLGWRRFVEGLPDFRPDWLRGAFRGAELLGGYQLHERWLHVGGACLPTGYIGGVVTRPEQRGQGVGSALMHDGVGVARARRYALVVLRGIPDFYQRFGYVDVMEVAEHVIDRAQLATLPPGECRTRPATLDDAPVLLELYERHYTPHPGYYVRTIEHQRHLLRHRRVDCPPILAVDAAGRPRGYALIAGSDNGARVIEAASDTWPAALALLQRHAQQVDRDSGAPATLTWLLPLDSLTYDHLADHLPLQTRISSRPHAGFLACPTDVPALCRSLQLSLAEHWQHWPNGRMWSVRIDVGDEHGVLEVVPASAHLPGGSSQATETIRLSPEVFLQLAFSFRSATWAATQPGQHVPLATVLALAALSPSKRACYPESNRC
jgi:GNAT superfamily N-acetyltransferase